IEAARGTPALLHPAGPLGSARAGALLAEVTPALATEAAALRARLEDLAALRAAQTEAAAVLERGLASVQAARVALSQAIADRTDLPLRLAESPEALARLAESADTLAALAGLLADTRLPPEAGSGFDAGPRGALPLPVAGEVVRGFHAGAAAAVPRPGLSIATEPGALVTTPTAATLRFAGPLAGYGNVVILEPADGVLLVLAGLGALFGQVGMVLPAGAPVGLMGGETPNTIADRAEVGGVRLSETLYMELRTEGAPTDPAPWFADRTAHADITTGEPTGP
ncbi:MAG: peptidoglycan DD-metalloendopeptidase family protein, partial [Rhodobacteraceae bacterium]|nr:peptidoglycan DD-metalloendopeptidase family protein [Paracoccaceae bacterium]